MLMSRTGGIKRAKRKVCLLSGLSWRCFGILGFFPWIILNASGDDGWKRGGDSWFTRSLKF